MEDALVLNYIIFIKTISNSLNPCFNGRCTRTVLNYIIFIKTIVLILVLMEDALVPNGIFAVWGVAFFGLNPCFNGRCTRTQSHYRL